MKTLPIIKCPVCGQEYILGEVFMPEEFFGKQKEIIKDEAGHIQFYIGSDPNFEEEYVCDNCNSILKINANVSFDVEAVSKDVEEEYVTEINKPKKIKLEEGILFD